MKELFIELIRELRRELDNKTINVRINYIKYEFTKDDRSYQLSINDEVYYYYSTWHNELALDNLPDIDTFMIDVNGVSLNVGRSMKDGHGLTDAKYNVVYEKNSRYTGAESFELYIRDNVNNNLYQVYTVNSVNDLINTMSNHCIGFGIFVKRYRYTTIIKFQDDCNIIYHNMPSTILQDYIRRQKKKYDIHFTYENDDSINDVMHTDAKLEIRYIND